MAKLRNTSDDVLELRLSTGFSASVEPDTVVEVPDDEFEAHTFPETLWHVVSGVKKPAGKSAAKDEE